MFQPNSLIAGRYLVVRLVGQGGMSNLYLAQDRKYGNAQVVIKEMTAAYSDPKEQQMAVELFHREAKLLASLNHRHIPKVYDYFQFAGKYYLSMEFIDGEDLAQKLEAHKGPLPEAQVLEWGEQIATVLFYLHKHDPPIVFRDVKPSNIMIAEQGVKLIDFGIARHFDQAKKGDTMRIGSPGYAPPEQYAAQTDPRSDIYALGVTLHHALTGRDPTDTQTPFLVPPARSLNPNLSEATAAMLARATQINPDDRYQNMLEMKNDIKHILAGDKHSTRVVGAPPQLASIAPVPPPSGGPPSATSSPATAAAAVAAAKSFVASVSAAAPPPAANALSGQAAASASASQATAASAPASGVTATSGQTATAPGQAAIAGQASPASSLPPQKASKKGRLVSLLIACLVLLFAGASFSLTPSQRDEIVARLKSLVESFSPPPSSQKAEDTIRKVFQKGDPQSLMALLEGGALEQLSPDKQTLYRLNLLAAEIDPESRSPKIIHLLYPEEPAQTNAEAALFKVCSQTVAAVNGQGGLDRKLIVVLPTAYSKSNIENILATISEQPAKGGQQVLILSSEPIALSPRSQKLNPFILEGVTGEQSGANTLSSLSDAELSSLFKDSLEQQEKLLWATSSSPAKIKGEKVVFNNSLSELASLLNKAAASNTRLVIEASKVSELPGIDSLNSRGQLLLLAIGTKDLPKLAPTSQAYALVLGSPLRQTILSAQNAKEVISPAGHLGAWQARVFDAIMLSIWDDSLGSYFGITTTRKAKSQTQPALIVNYRWTASGWVPDFNSNRK